MRHFALDEYDKSTGEQIYKTVSVRVFALGNHTNRREGQCLSFGSVSPSSQRLNLAGIQRLGSRPRPSAAEAWEPAQRNRNATRPRTKTAVVIAAINWGLSISVSYTEERSTANGVCRGRNSVHSGARGSFPPGGPSAGDGERPIRPATDFSGRTLFLFFAVGNLGRLRRES